MKKGMQHDKIREINESNLPNIMSTQERIDAGYNPQMLIMLALFGLGTLPYAYHHKLISKVNE